MPNRILVSVEEGLEEPSWLKNIGPFMEKACQEASYDGQEISVLFCSDSFIQDLNKQYRNIDSPTDVLSFEDGEEYTDEEGKTWLCAGDIVISLDTLPKNSEYFKVTENNELKRLLVHGLLHLNGLDHGDEHVEEGKEPECEMLKIQKDILQKFEKDVLIG